MTKVKSRPPRPGEVEGRAKAFLAARIARDEGISQKKAADRISARESSVQEAMTILLLGTAEQIADVEAGRVAMGPMARHLRSTATPEQKRAAYREPVRTGPENTEGREFDAQVWGHLRAAIDALTSLPKPDDVINIVRKNGMRVEYVGRNVLAAQTWLEEFVNGYTK